MKVLPIAAIWNLVSATCVFLQLLSTISCSTTCITTWNELDDRVVQTTILISSKTSVEDIALMLLNSLLLYQKLGEIFWESLFWSLKHQRIKFPFNVYILYIVLNFVSILLLPCRGKKAKRKAREKQLEEARRLASLQKKRELKAAGIEMREMRKKSRGINYNNEVAFERRPAQGFYDVGEEREMTKEMGKEFRPVTLEEMEGRRRKVRGDDNDDCE